MPSRLISLTISKILSTRIGARPIDGSSSSSRRGRAISARPIAHICCSPPDSVPAFWSRRSCSRGNSVEDARRCRSRSRPGRRAGTRPSRGSRARVMRAEEPPALGRLGDAELHDRRAAGALRDLLALEARSLPRRGRLIALDRAQRRRLAGAVGADQRDDLALVDGQRDALERLDRAVVGLDVVQLEQRRADAVGAAPRRLASVAGPRSTAPHSACRRSDGALAEVGLDHARVGWISAGEPSAIFSPWSSTVTRSETPITTFMSCSISSTVRPALVAQPAHERREVGGSPAGSCRRSARRAAAAWARSPARGRPRAGAGRRTAGCARVLVDAPAEPDEAQDLGARSRALALLAAQAGRAQELRDEAALECGSACPTSTFSSALMFWNRRMFWNVRADAQLRRCGAAAGRRSRVPSNATSPQVGV